MTEPTSIKERLLTGLFGEGGQTKVTFELNGDTIFDHMIVGPRVLRAYRFRRFASAVVALYVAVHLFCQYFGLVWDPYTNAWEVITGLLLIGTAIFQVVFAELSLLRHQKTRTWAQQLAEQLDDMVEDWPEAFTPEDRAKMKTMSIDMAVHAQDPTQYDRPWWRLRDPLARG